MLRGTSQPDHGSLVESSITQHDEESQSRNNTDRSTSYLYEYVDDRHNVLAPQHRGQAPVFEDDEAPDIVHIIFRGGSWPISFPPYSIAEEYVTVKHVRDRVAERLNLPNQVGRVRLVYKDKDLRRNDMPLRKYGCKHNSEICAIVTTESRDYGLLPHDIELETALTTEKNHDGSHRTVPQHDISRRLSATSAGSRSHGASTDLPTGLSRTEKQALSDRNVGQAPYIADVPQSGGHGQRAEGSPQYSEGYLDDAYDGDPVPISRQQAMPESPKSDIGRTDAGPVGVAANDIPDLAFTLNQRPITPPPNQTINNSTMNFSPYALHPDDKVRLRFEGNLDGVARQWTVEEIRIGRKIVVFSRENRGRDIHASFKVIVEEKWDNEPGSVSCMWWSAKQEAFVSIVDTVLLLEWMISTVFTVEEKKRIRRNLEAFRPETISEDKADTKSFFRTVTKLSNPMPRTIDEDIKVLPWKVLPVALHRIVSKYSIRFPNRLSNPMGYSISQDLGPPTDSGYASWCPPGAQALLASDTSRIIQSDESNQSELWEIKTTYSDTTSIDTVRRDGFVEKFAEILLRDVIKGLSDDALENATFSDGMEELLADFAVRLGHGTTVPELRRSTIFLHKYRSSISSFIRQQMHDTSETASDEGQRSLDKPPVSEIMQMWFERGYDQEQDPVVEESNAIASSLEEFSEAPEYDLQEYERLITASPAYQWLVGLLQNRSLLTSTKPDIMESIRAEVCKHVPKPTHISSATVATEARFEIALDPTNCSDFDSVLTVTGSQQDAQALTCVQYIQQTWPTNGMALWQLVKDSLHVPGQHVTITLADNVFMWAHMSTTSLTIRVLGTRSVLIEAAEQVCWINAALSLPPYHFGQVRTLCTPSLKLIRRLVVPKDDRQVNSDSGKSDQLSVSSTQYRTLKPDVASAQDTRPSTVEHVAKRMSSLKVSSKESHNLPKSSQASIGCARCKRKHLQCDESRPSCAPCRKFGTVCIWDVDGSSNVAASRVSETTQEPANFEFESAGTTLFFKVNLEYQTCKATAQPGTCWHSLFQKCVIIHGFPMRRRPTPELGLELSLEIMCKLMGTQYLYTFSERLFFKQYYLMLTPAHQNDNLLIWHLCKSEDNERISYLDHGLPDMHKIGYNDLSDFRHIVGWCSSVKHLAGHVSGHYDVESPDLEPVSPSGSLFNCSLSFGRPVSGGTTLFYAANERTLLAKRNYLDMLRFLERRFILLWDTDTSRGWLINGLRVTLHILRQSFRLDEKEDLGGLFVLKLSELLESQSPDGAQAAREFLSNPKNLNLKVSISNFGGAEIEYETLSNRFERIYDIVEQAFDYQSKPRKWDHIPRMHLEGWDFLSIARKDDIVSPLMCNLPSLGRSWVDFVRAINAVTLMGAGFGEMLQCGIDACKPVPRDRFCLAVSLLDLLEATRMKRCLMHSKPRFLCRVPPVVWHSPRGSSRQRDHMATQEDSGFPRQQCLQVMWPAEQTAVLPAEDNEFTLEGRYNGAVIFGHDESLQHYIPNLGYVPLSGCPPEPTKELGMIDSGIGSSLNSMPSLDRIKSRSTLSPFGEPQSTSGISNSQRNLYGDAFMSGGYGIFGNVSGNLSVTQYFGAGNARSSSSSQPDVALRGPDMAPQQAKGVELQRPLPQDQSPDNVAGERWTNSVDLELEQAQMEIKTLGLEDYCDVFRW